jgi:hypothetical protein
MAELAYRVQMIDWIGPFTIEQVLRGCINDSFPKPPESQSAYLVSFEPWTGRPSTKCQPLYIGSNTGQSKRFRTRIGDLLADLFGFFCDDTGHHSGGQSLHNYCRAERIDPLVLYIAWVKSCDCHRCLENDLYQELKPRLNKNVPSSCRVHT